MQCPRLPIVLIAALTAAAALSTGCATIERPEVFVTNIVPLESTVFEPRVQVDLRILNPNRFELPVDGLDFKLDLNHVRLARGVSNQPFVLPGLGEATTSVTASASLFDVLHHTLLLSRQSAAPIPYRIAGRAHLGASSIAARLPRTISFDRAGEVNPSEWLAAPDGRSPDLLPGGFDPGP